MAEHYSVLIRGVTVVDGTGAPRYTNDVALEEDRIARIGSLDSLRAEHEVDGCGLVLAPGFVDAHTHDDSVELPGGDATPKVSQGVTTVIGGNCGCSIAPMPRPMPDPVPPPLDLIAAKAEWKYRRFADYATALKVTPPMMNCAMLVGHNTLRVAVMDDLQRPANSKEIRRMRDLVDQSLDEGAIGVSTGLAYAPGRCAPIEEVIEICEPLHDHQGLYCTHMRNEGDDIIDSLKETFRVGAELDIPVNISHHKIIGARNQGRSRETLALIAKRMASQRIYLDCYPYTASSTVLLPERVETAARTLITWSKRAPQYAGWDLVDVVADMGTSLGEAIVRLQPAGAVYHNMADEDVERILSFDATMVGSDGLPNDEWPHPRLWGTFARVLGHYSRDRGLFSLEQAVRKMTGLTAQNFGLTDRGVIREGAYADLTLFDASGIAERATYRDPMRRSQGVRHVWVNGKLVWTGGRLSGVRPGRLLTRNN